MREREEEVGREKKENKKMTEKAAENKENESRYWKEGIINFAKSG